MKCTSPLNLTHKTRGRISVSCCQCMSCRVNRSLVWSFRCMCELMYWSDASFVTLTYDDDHLPMDFGLHKWHYQNFLKSLRKRIDFPIRYFMCGEYGEKVLFPETGLGRPHFHFIIFGLNPVVHRKLIQDCWSNCDWRILDSSPRGRKSIGSVTFDSVKYVAGYIQKKLLGKSAEETYLRQLLVPPFQACSGKFGLQFALDNVDRLKRDTTIRYRNYVVPLPRYFVEKLGLKNDSEYNQTVLRQRYENDATLLDEFYELSALRGFAALNSRPFSVYKCDRIPEVTTVQRDDLLVKNRLFQRSL